MGSAFASDGAIQQVFGGFESLCQFVSSKELKSKKEIRALALFKIRRDAAETFSAPGRPFFLFYLCAFV
jgi:hypothetical protein